MIDDLTVEQGIEIQKEHLRLWGNVLKPHIHEKLTRIATKNNHKATSGYHICRGTDLDEIVHTLSRVYIDW